MYAELVSCEEWWHWALLLHQATLQPNRRERKRRNSYQKEIERKNNKKQGVENVRKMSVGSSSACQGSASLFNPFDILMSESNVHDEMEGGTDGGQEWSPKLATNVPTYYVCRVPSSSCSSAAVGKVPTCTYLCCCASYVCRLGTSTHTYQWPNYYYYLSKC